MRENHPAAAKKWTLAEYAKWESVVVSLIGDGRSDIDARLAKAGLARRIGLSIPHFMGCLAVVSATDMITTTSRLVATRYAKTYRLVVRDPPFPEIRFNNTITASALRMNDPVIRWFCTLVKEVFEAVQQEVMQGRPPRRKAGQDAAARTRRVVGS